MEEVAIRSHGLVIEVHAAPLSPLCYPPLTAVSRLPSLPALACTLEPTIHWQTFAIEKPTRTGGDHSREASSRPPLHPPVHIVPFAQGDGSPSARLSQARMERRGTGRHVFHKKPG